MPISPIAKVYNECPDHLSFLQNHTNHFSILNPNTYPPTMYQSIALAAMSLSFIILPQPINAMFIQKRNDTASIPRWFYFSDQQNCTDVCARPGDYCTSDDQDNWICHDFHPPEAYSPLLRLFDNENDCQTYCPPNGCTAGGQTGWGCYLPWRMSYSADVCNEEIYTKYEQRTAGWLRETSQSLHVYHWPGEVCSRRFGEKGLSWSIET